MGRGFRETNTAEKDAMANNPGNIDWDAVHEEEETKTRGFQLIGEFIFRFSQLEFTIKARLQTALCLPDDVAEAVTTPYDFAVLCTVTQTVLLTKYPPAKKPEIDEVFKNCRKLNDERVRIAHGMWTHARRGLVARYASRSKLKAEFFYEDPEALSKLTTEAKRLMLEVMQVPSTPKQGAIERIGVEILMDPEPTEEKKRPSTRRQKRRPETR
jgi:hypothetical protein